MSRITRREFLKQTGAGLLTPYLLLSDAEAQRFARRSAKADPLAINRFRNPHTTFPLSVASGDPSPTGVVLWTRIEPRVWDPAEELGFQVALDPSFRRIVQQGTADSASFGPVSDYTVHIDLDGQLKPHTVYFFRFIYNQTASRTGRCRTLPEPGHPLEDVCFAVLTCQDFRNGFYGALSHVAVDPHVDFVVHLGDFIYERSSNTANGRVPFPERLVRLPDARPLAFDLNDYRTLYRRYRSDPWLQLAMEFHTWIIIWDDHETACDSYWDYDRDTLGAPEHPLQVDPAFGNDPAALRRLKLDAQRAWSEYIPARPRFDPQAGHPHQALNIRRSFRFGDLVELFMTDERTFRSGHPCGEQQLGGRILNRDCPARSSPEQTMLGEGQRDWFINAVTGSDALWKAWGNEVFLGELSAGPPEPDQFIANMDAWDGYLAERLQVLESFRNGSLDNLIALTGDLHSYLAAFIKMDYADRSNTNPDNVMGVEFMTPSVTSSNIAEQLSITDPPGPSGGVPSGTGQAPQYFLERFVRATNPHVQFFNSQDFGYATVIFTRTHCEYTAFAVDKTVNQFQPKRKTIRRIRVPVNETRMQHLPVGS